MSNAAQLSARDRILSLLDDNSFVEVGAFVTRRSTDFNLSQAEVPGDGVITGYGVVDGNLVYVYSQDASALGGSIGEMHAKKIVNIYNLALKVGAPVVGLIDSSGLRLQEATDALNGFGEIYLKQTLASGVIPQITAVFGSCGGGLAVMASLSDFSFMEGNNSKLFVNSPNALQGNYKDKCNTASASFQSEAGTVDYVAYSESEVISKLRELLSILPSNNEVDESYEDCKDDLNRLLPSLQDELGNISDALKDISDQGFYLEMKADFANEVVTAFIRLNGRTVGAIGNRTEYLAADGITKLKLDGKLTTDACYKAEKFVNFCDAFNIPLLTLTSVVGFKATIEEEKTIAKAVAKLTHAFANATVAKVNVVVGKAYGSGYIAMNSKHIGADMVFALPGASIGMMEANLAAQIMYAGEDKVTVEEKTRAYAELQSSPEAAAKRGYVDSIIEPETLRQHLIYSYEMLFTKSEERPNKKHSSI